jgi:hypothetical protein
MVVGSTVVMNSKERSSMTEHFIAESREPGARRERGSASGEKEPE